jgi:hypothetical protein
MAESPRVRARNDGSNQASGASAPTRGGLLHPGVPILLIANLYPLIGVVLWGWDAFLLLILYWAETVVVAFWTIIEIAQLPRGTAGALETSGGRKLTAPFAIAGFFTVHSGIFISVHLVFLWTLFSGDWPKRTGGLLPFFRHAIGTEGLWVPLAFLFIARGAFVLLKLLPNGLVPWVAREDDLSRPAAKNKMDGLMMGLYGRIVVMQVAIIFGAWFAMAIGSMAPLILLILAKTIADLVLLTRRSKQPI